MAAEDSWRKFLDPKNAALVRQYDLLARLIVDGYLAGHHRGPRNAFSLEYDKHRDYYPGDAPKSVDWKLYGKTDKLYVKQYEEETNLEAWIVIDISQSMLYSGKIGSITKQQYAFSLAAAFTYALLGQQDHVGLMLFDSRLRTVIAPSASRKQLIHLVQAFHDVPAGRPSDFAAAARLAAGRIHKRALVFLFTDLLTKPEIAEKTLKLFLRRGNDLMLFQILTEEEIRFPFKRFGFFEDMETKNRVLLQPELYHDEYVRKMKQYLESIRAVTQKLKIGYEMMSTITPYDQALKRFFERREKMQR